MFYRWEDPYSNWELDFKQCSFDRAVRILHHLPFNIFRISMLFTHALVPSAFRLQVSARIQESPSKFFLTASGILKPRHAAHRSKTPTAGVVTRPAFQEAWQIVSPWVWNLRLELGHVLEPTPLRTTEFAPPVTETTEEQGPVQGYDKPSVALRLQSGSFLGAGLRPPTRRGAALSRWQDVAPNRAAKLCRWQSARARASPGYAIVASAQS